jgi:Calpain family cysteine protease
MQKHEGLVTWVRPPQASTLFRNGVSFADAIQATVADCYFVAALASLAQKNPQAIYNAVRDNQDGTYSVRFFRTVLGVHRPVYVTVDDDVAAIDDFKPYARALDPKEQWVAVFEKAYAKFKGSYEAINHFGEAGIAFEEVTGKKSRYRPLAKANPEKTWRAMSQTLSKGKGVVAATHEEGTFDFGDSGIHGSHSYAVLSMEGEGKARMVTLYNPWGFGEGGDDDSNDGVFQLPYDEFRRLFDSVHLAG